MPNINLDERRQSREEQSVTANGHVYVLPAYMPAVLMETGLALMNVEANPEAAVGAMREMYVALFGEKQADAAMRDIGLNELQDITNEVYSVTAGEAPASVNSSSTNGTRSRRTSRGSTTST